MNPTLRLALISWLAFSCTARDVAPPPPLLPVPTARQLAWHELEQYAFVHFTTNTFTGKEWGFGDEDPAIFNPTDFDAGQWAKIIQAAGLKGIILTTKHHDGFCLWPSAYTDHSVKASPFRGGQGDVVGETARACRENGLLFGVYLSPWDRNHPDYGSEAYITYYRNQLRELFTRYGPVFEMWFDGANGGDGFYGGKREVRKIDGATYYHWPNTLALVREMAPEVIFFSDAGPDIRWVGNERGIAGRTNWCTIDPDTLYAGKPGIESLLNSGTEGGKAWIPAEVDVSIRPGWFYHAEEDDRVKSPEQLFDIYLSSVGRGANLLLNLPPDRRGRIHELDSAALMGWKRLRDTAFANNLAQGEAPSASATRGKSRKYDARNLTDGDLQTYWTTDDDLTTAWVEIPLSRRAPVRYVMVQEHIALGQRVSEFAIDAWVKGEWQEVARETTIGYKRLTPLEAPVETDRIRIRILEARACPVLSEVAVF